MREAGRWWKNGWFMVPDMRGQAVARRGPFLIRKARMPAGKCCGFFYGRSGRAEASELHLQAGFAEFSGPVAGGIAE
jgi:hypothetical protein